ncbi:MAG: hypothetical protein WKF42_05100 [Solirubrobacteraceae bacterium]
MPDYATPHQAAPRPRAGVDMQTLWITAAASAAAAYACSQIWTPGTLAAAAFTPVLVAILKEALAKSTEVVVRAVPVRGVVRSARPEGPQQSDPRERATVIAADDDDAASRVSQAGEIQYHGSSGRRRGWRVAIVTGLLGFLVAAVVFTVPELVAGGSAAGNGRGTTIFGGGGGRDRPEPAVTTTTPTNTVTAPPEKTVPAPTATPTGPPTTTVPPPAVTQTVPPPPPPPVQPDVPEPPTAQPPG